MNNPYNILEDKIETKEVRYISFMGKFHRYDLAFMKDEKNPAKKVVINLRENHFAILGHEDLDSDSKLAHLLQVTELEANELCKFLEEVL